MNIKPVERNIRNLLTLGKQLIIPRFQREYSWDKAHYQEFFEDILDSLFVNTEGKVGCKQYFLGTMLFVEDFSNKSKEMEVVDGQQRLTTITILFSALADCFCELNNSTLQNKIFEYIMMHDDNGEEKRVLKTTTNYPYFAYYIQDKDKARHDNPVTEEEQCIEKTYKYFKKCLQASWLKAYFENKKNTNLANASIEELLKAIRDQVLECIFISISTDTHEQANQLFEILNAKGKRLGDIDLIKNKLFEYLDRNEPVDDAVEQWKKMRDLLQKNCENSVSIADFYRHYWSSVYGTTTRTKLYDEFKKIKPKNYSNLLSDMVKNAIYYTQIANPKIQDYNNRTEYSYLVQSLKAFDEFGVVQVRVPLLSLYDAKENAIVTHKDFKKAVLAMENFHFAYTALSHSRPNKLEKIYSTFAQNLRKVKNKSEARELITSDLIGELDKIFPSYDEFVRIFTALTYSRHTDRDNLVTKYALRKLNAYFAGKEVFESDSSVEHILAESSSSDALNLGNLILLEQNLNTEASDKNYMEKKSIYARSNYKWVTKFVDKHETWEIENIRERAQFLSEVYYTKILGRQI